MSGMEREEIIKKLKISQNEFDIRVRELKEHFGELLSEEIAILLAAYSFGYEPIYSIEEIAERRGKVIVEGAVERIGSMKENVAIAILKDRAASIKVVFWNDAAQLIKAGDVAEGDKLRIKGFVKKRDKDVELSVREASDVEILEKGEVSREVIRGVILGIAQRSKGRNLVKAIIANESGITTCVAWDEKAEKLMEIEVGSSLEIRGVTRHGELVVSELRVIDEKISFNVDFVAISNIMPLRHVNLRGRISGLGEVRRVKMKGREATVAEVYLSDETGRVKVLLWDENAYVYKKADIGDHVEIFNAYPKIGWEEVEVHCGWNSIVTLRKVY
jgi:replication factor A1